MRAVLQALGLATMQAVLVDHCKHAFGIVLTSKRGWKFVFSGDTQRCDNLIAAATGATVLVHEATFENEKQDDARYKKHSTIADALDVRNPLLYTRETKLNMNHAVVSAGQFE
jgi:ribonuclease Z